MPTAKERKRRSHIVSNIPTKDDVEDIITNRILKYHKKLVKDYGLQRTSYESQGGVTTRCTEDSH